MTQFSFRFTRRASSFLIRAVNRTRKVGQVFKQYYLLASHEELQNKDNRHFPNHENSDNDRVKRQ